MKNSHVKFLVLHIDRNIIDALQVLALYHAITIHITEIGNLFQDSIIQMFLGSQHKNIRLDSYALQFLHRMLGRLGLQFSRSFQIGHISEMNIDGPLTQLPFQLADSFHERRTLDVTNGTAYLGNHKVIPIFGAQKLDIALDFIGDMGHYLNSLA